MNDSKDASDAQSGRDAALAAVTVGELTPHNASVHLAPYDPVWPARFATLATRIHETLGARVLQLEHVGSTSVPGLSAKPIIDIVLAVADSGDEPAYVASLEQSGFGLRIREPDWFQHRLLKAQDVDCNLHVFSAGCAEIDRMLVFRDWLRSRPDDRARYEATKRTLAQRTWRHVQDYADAKSEVVREILARAIEAAPGEPR
jgi:GrpB-like predicted nucleotidyltransferase (UPF0157 family)